MMAPLPEHRQAAPGELEHSAPVERDRGAVRSAASALGSAIGRSRLAPAAPAQCKRAVTRDILDQLIETCATDRLTDTGISRSFSWRSRQAGAAAATRRGCASSS